MQVLNGVAGWADVVAYLGLGHVFTANMTGNTVLLGIGLIDRGGRGRLLPDGPVPPAVALVAFAVGALLAALVLRVVRGSTGYRLVLLLEAGLLAGTALGWALTGSGPDFGRSLALVATVSLAMGAQGALANRVGVAGVPTTVVTSTIVTALTRSVHGGPVATPALAWALYLAGAAGGAAAIRVLDTGALWPTVAVLAVLVALPPAETG
jgi:uncharacterized membrane protein YoaK (UPF0700 family)